MAIQLGQKPEGLLIKPADVFRWLPGLSSRQWRKLRPTLTPVSVGGQGKPFYRRAEIEDKVVKTIQVR